MDSKARCWRHVLHSTHHGMQILATCSAPPTNTRQKLNTHILMDCKTCVFGATRLLSAGRFLVYAAFLPNLPPRHSDSTPECTPNVSQSTPSSNPQGQTICSIRGGLFFQYPRFSFLFLLSLVRPRWYIRTRELRSPVGPLALRRRPKALTAPRGLVL